MPKPASRKHDWKDEYTLLCERCGYIIEDLDQALPCPECGKPIAESLPDRRVGTPQQQIFSFKNARKSWWLSICHPIKTLDSMRFNLNDHEHIASMNIFIALLIPGLTYLAITFIEWVSIAAISLVAFAVLIGPAWAALMFITEIESLGLRFLGKRRRFRITHNISSNIVAHGSVGWVIAGLGASFGMVLSFTTYQIRIFTMRDDKLSQYDHILIEILNVGIWSIPISILAGFLFFETFAYLGLRRCKYANRSRPTDTPKP